MARARMTYLSEAERQFVHEHDVLMGECPRCEPSGSGCKPVP